MSVHNFSAGPAVLPASVVSEAGDALGGFGASGLGILECSHRSADFSEVIDSARSRMAKLLGVGDDYEVLFLHGGARTQFFQIPMNLLRGGRATYLDTGIWSKQAIAEARRFGTVDVPFSSAETSWDRVPRPGSWGSLPEGTTYLHYTSNNTVAGTEYDYVPDAGDALLVCDMSSDFLSRPLDGRKFALIYGGAQKNLGPAGTTVVVFRRDLLDRCDPDLPTMLRYATHVQKHSLYNTPCTFAIYVIERVLRWIEAEGGLGVIEARNRAQAARVYEVLDGSGFWRGKVAADSRSLMNVTFTTGDPDLDTLCWKEAAAAGLIGLKGHRSVGGLRASLYNAQTEAAVDALTDFLTNFERQKG